MTEHTGKVRPPGSLTTARAGVLLCRLPAVELVDRWGQRRSFMVRRFAAGVVATMVAALLIAVPASARTDYSGPAYNILAPGEYGGLPATQYSTDQGALYNALTPLEGHVTPADVAKDYLSEKFGVTGPVVRSEQTGRPGSQDPARQQRHPAHLREDPRRRDVRVRVGGRRGSRAASARRTRPGLSGHAGRPRDQPLRPRDLGPLVHSQRRRRSRSSPSRRTCCGVPEPRGARC